MPKLGDESAKGILQLAGTLPIGIRRGEQNITVGDLCEDLLEARRQVRLMLQLSDRRRIDELKEIAERYGGIHIGDCPADDTCECPGKVYNDAIQTAIVTAVRLEGQQ